VCSRPWRTACALPGHTRLSQACQLLCVPRVLRVLLCSLVGAREGNNVCLHARRHGGHFGPDMVTAVGLGRRHRPWHRGAQPRNTFAIADDGAACWVHCCSAMVTASAPAVSRSEHGLAACHESAVRSYPHQAGSNDLLVAQARLTGYLGFIGVSSWVARENLFALMVTSSCSTIVRSCLLPPCMCVNCWGACWRAS
jgi:hypothetical protein